VVDEEVRTSAEGDDEEAPLSPKAKAASTVAFVLIGAVLLVVFVRLTSPAIQPEQKAPSAHVPGPCGLCHAVSADAKPIEVK
jgi:hypothetical protein